MQEKRTLAAPKKLLYTAGIEAEILPGVHIFPIPKPKAKVFIPV